ncbi:hypothetical protein ACJQWK_08176 [Exserohilum turcicum]
MASATDIWRKHPSCLAIAPMDLGERCKMACLGICNPAGPNQRLHTANQAFPGPDVPDWSSGPFAHGSVRGCACQGPVWLAGIGQVAPGKTPAHVQKIVFAKVPGTQASLKDHVPVRIQQVKAAVSGGFNSAQPVKTMDFTS